MKTKSIELGGNEKQGSITKRKNDLNNNNTNMENGSQRSVASSSTLSQLSSESLGALGGGDDNDNLLDRKINMFLKGTAPTINNNNRNNNNNMTSSAAAPVASKSKQPGLPSVNVANTLAVVYPTAPVVNKNTTTTTAATAPVTKSVKSASAPPLRASSSEGPTHVSVAQRASSPSIPPPSAPIERPRTQPALDIPSDFSTTDIPDMAIRVVVRKRPISRAELQRGDLDVMEIDEAGGVYIHEPKVRVDLTKVTETHQFYFDDAFEADESNELMYSRTIGQLIPFMFDGGKASCFAYGQTGSGKTFTMMGANPAAPDTVVENAGLYVIAARDIFRYLQTQEYKNLQLFVSCFEIYSGKLFDLLNDRGIVKCLEDAKQQVQLVGLSEHRVESVSGLLALMGKGHAMRSTGCTGANATSSRSHQIMQLVVKEFARAETPSTTGGFGSRHRNASSAPVLVPRGKLSFIDLAGSERGADTCNASKQTRLEGAEINTSLLALKEVIRSLERKHGHTPFRGSKLTQVLKDSFVGEKSRTCMIACVSPSHSNCEHTLNTLRYADRVKEHQSSQSASTTPLNPDSERPSSPLARESRGGGRSGSGSGSGPPSPSRGLSGSPVRGIGIASSPEKNGKSVFSGRVENRPPPLPPMAPTSSRSALSNETHSSRRASVGNQTSRPSKDTADPLKSQRRTSLAPTLSTSASASSKVNQQQQHNQQQRQVPTKPQDLAARSTKGSNASNTSARGQVGTSAASAASASASVSNSVLAENSTNLLAAHKSTIAKLVEVSSVSFLHIYSSFIHAYIGTV